MKKFVILLFSVLTLISCKNKDEKSTDIEGNSQFFDIVYITQASREINTTTWYATTGAQRVKFVKTGTSESGGDFGSFTVQYTGYKESQLSTGLCSGGYAGTFTQESSGPVEEEDVGPYNPLDPYNPGSSDTGGGTLEGDTDGDGIIDTAIAFVYNLTVTEESYGSTCPASINPPATFNLRIIRFPNGDITITQSIRSLEFYLFPELIQ